MKNSKVNETNKRTLSKKKLWGVLQLIEEHVGILRHYILGRHVGNAVVVTINPSAVSLVHNRIHRTRPSENSTHYTFSCYWQFACIACPEREIGASLTDLPVPYWTLEVLYTQSCSTHERKHRSGRPPLFRCDWWHQSNHIYGWRGREYSAILDCAWRLLKVRRHVQVLETVVGVCEKHTYNGKSTFWQTFSIPETFEERDKGKKLAVLIWTRSVQPYLMILNTSTKGGRYKTWKRSQSTIWWQWSHR